MKIHKNDKVKILTGKQKGQEGVVLRVYSDKNHVVVEKVNIVTKHVKPSRLNQGGIMKVEKPINVSNVILICPACSKPTRVGYQIIDGKKYRICKKCKEVINYKKK